MNMAGLTCQIFLLKSLILSRGGMIRDTETDSFFFSQMEGNMGIDSSSNSDVGKTIDRGALYQGVWV